MLQYCCQQSDSIAHDQLPDSIDIFIDNIWFFVVLASNKPWSYQELIYDLDASDLDVMDKEEHRFWIFRLIGHRFQKDNRNLLGYTQVTTA